MRKVSARVRANRLNGKKSTGPKTVEGRTRSARNALKHGLARPLVNIHGASECAENLAHSWVGPDAEPIQMEQARKAAEAHLELERIEARRIALLSGPWVKEVRKSSRTILREANAWLDIQEKMSRVVEKDNPTERDVTRLEQLIEKRKSISLTPMIQETEMDFVEIASELIKLERYERRARSRRKKALRELDRLQDRERRAQSKSDD
jgi:chromosome segregation ATPase